MLILGRMVGQIIRIGDDIEITVVGVKGNQVRLGIEAPKDVEVHREEIYEKIQVEKQLNIKYEPKIKLKHRSSHAKES